jgi:hypothetical protein
MPRYTLLPGKKHLFHDGKTGFRHLKPGETVELSETTYAALSDKFVPEGTALKAEDVETMRKALEESQRELAELKERFQAEQRAKDTQSPATGEANNQATPSTAPGVTKATSDTVKPESAPPAGVPESQRKITQA